MNTPPAAPSGRWLRRARPLLGTLVEIGLVVDQAQPLPDATLENALQAAFEAIAQVQASMSRFEPDSDIARFGRLPVGASLSVRAGTAEVLRAAQALHTASGGIFDISLGTGLEGWHCDGLVLEKRLPAVQLDLGGIAKGYAVDCAVSALQQHGSTAGWVNAGGDLRAFGPITVPISLRDEQHGGVRAFASLNDGAFATSHFDKHSRSQLARREQAASSAHVSVAAPHCLWADALTKVVAVTGDVHHALLAQHGAQAWRHRIT